MGKKISGGKKLRAAVSGMGRMGKAVRRLIQKSAAMDMADFAGRSRYPDMWAPPEIDGVIDFSLPPLFSKTLDWCLKNKKPFVSGTTGLSQAQRRRMMAASKQIPVFYAENMSRGIFLLGGWMSSLPRGEERILIEDIHHSGKKDRPSGTALRLKAGFPAPLQKKIRIKSLRRGREFGTHRIFLETPEEVLTLEHKALSRDVFAKGALLALLFLSRGKSAGFYSLNDLYGQKNRRKPPAGGG